MPPAVKGRPSRAVDQAPKNFDVDADNAVLNLCQTWFDVANGRVYRHDPNDLVTQLSLLRILNVRQALIKWQAWNCRIDQADTIRQRHISFVEQVRLMAQLLRVRPPPIKTVVDKRTPALQTTRILLQYDCTHWLDEQLVKTAGILRPPARANLYHEAHELFMQLRFELDREWSRQQTELVLMHEDQRHADILNANVAAFSLVLTVLSMAIYVVDVGSDIVASMVYLNGGQHLRGGLTMLWVLWTSVVIWVSNPHKRSATKSPLVTTGLLFCPGLPLLYLLHELQIEWRIWNCRGTISERQQLMVELEATEQVATSLTYTEANNQALPQLLMHIQFLMRQTHRTPFSYLTIISMGSSILSACWSYMINFRGMYSPTSSCYRTQCILFVQECSGFVAMYIVMSLFFWVAPIWVASSMWIFRTFVFMYLDKMLGLRETISEMSTVSACVTFIERFLFYATHPFRPKLFKYGAIAGGLIELGVVIQSYAFASCTQHEAFLFRPVILALAVLGFSILVRNLSVWLQITEW